MAVTAISIVPWPEIMTVGTSRLLAMQGAQDAQPIQSRALQPDVQHDQRGASGAESGNRRI